MTCHIGMPMTIFRGFRRLLEALEAIAEQLATLTASQDELARLQREMGPGLDRVEKLEISRHQFEAEIEGMLLRAEGKLKAASNAEARERQLKKSYEKHILDPLDPDSQESTEEGQPAFLARDAARSEAERLHPVHLDLAPNNKADAVRAKWSR